MSFFQKLIDWIMSLFGAKKQPAQLTAGQQQQIQKNAIQGLDEVQGAEHIHVHGTGANARVLKQVDGAALVEEDGESQWVNQVNSDMPREAWRDDWGPLAAVGDRTKRLEEFVFHEQEFDHTRATDPLAAEQKLLGFGYGSVGHFFRVRATVVKHYATPHGPSLDQSVFDSQEFMNAGMKAAARQHESKMQATVNANPELLSPVEGVTVEKYAEIAARVAQSIPQDQLLALLAQNGLDMPAWQRVNAVWTDRMSKDTTATIATIYGRAFMGSGQGQYGAAGAAAGNRQWDGSAAGGAEPVPFEKFCEIDGAMRAWSKTGQDVNAMLKQVFDMVAADYSNVSVWWMSQLTANLSRFNEYNAKVEAYEKKYSGPQQRHDQDISF